MPAQIRALLDKIIEWWNKFTTRQKTLIIVGASVAVLTVAILVAVFTRPTYVHLYTATANESSQVKELLDGSETPIDYKVSPDGRTFTVNKKNEADANLILLGNQIRTSRVSIDAVTSGGFSTTESDKQKMYVAYLEGYIGEIIDSIDAIESSKVKLNVPNDNGTLLAQKEESSVWIQVRLKNKEDFNEDNAAFLARAVAAAMGNETTDGVVITDTESNLLFAGGSDGSSGYASSQLTYKSKAEQQVKSRVRDVLLGTSMYDRVEVASNLTIDFDNVEDVTHLFYAPEGQTQGVLSHEDNYTSENNSGVAGVPGTDAQDETTYVLQDNNNVNSSVEENSRDYLPNERITTRVSEGGGIDPLTSSISVTAINYVVQNQENYNPDDHDGLSWAEFKNANAVPVLQTDEEVIDSMRQLVASATGIPLANVTMALYDENIFYDREGLPIGITDILQIILIVAILALLAFVILRSMRTVREQEEDMPAELSVESLLESQPLDEGSIDLEDSSETKRLIEKFVDENPEAAAHLLRNWLNEGFI